MGNARVKSIIVCLILTSIFITGSPIARPGFSVEWFHFIYVPFALVMTVKYHRFSRGIAIIFFLVVLDAIIFSTWPDFSAIKQVANIGISMIVFYYLLLFCEFDFEEIFRYYVLIGKMILVLGFVQVLFFLPQLWNIPSGKFFFLAFPFLEHTNISVRFQSLTQEPAEIAFAFTPIIFLALNNLIHGRRFLLTPLWSIFFLLGYILTFSLLAYAGLLVMLVVVYFRNFSWLKIKAATVFILLMVATSFVVINVTPQIKTRVDDTVFGLSRTITDTTVYRSLNLSTYSLLSNAWVAKHSAEDHPVFGTGIGSYERSWNYYLPEDMRKYSQLNKDDANSLAFRLLTEWGLTGFFLFCLFIFRYRISFRSDQSENQLYCTLSNGILVLIILYLIRDGNYTHQGKMMFLFLYYYLWKENRA